MYDICEISATITQQGGEFMLQNKFYLKPNIFRIIVIGVLHGTERAECSSNEILFPTILQSKAFTKHSLSHIPRITCLLIQPQILTQDTIRSIKKRVTGFILYPHDLQTFSRTREAPLRETAIFDSLTYFSRLKPALNATARAILAHGLPTVDTGC